MSNPDPQESEKNIKDWESFQLICYYDNRPPSLEEYCEDMLAMCIYCGALINVESNKKRLIEYFIDEGFGGYLWRGTNPDGTIKKEYGTYAGGGTKNDMLNGIRDFIEYRAHKTKIKVWSNDVIGVRRLRECDVDATLNGRVEQKYTTPESEDVWDFVC